MYTSCPVDDATVPCKVSAGGDVLGAWVSSVCGAEGWGTSFGKYGGEVVDPAIALAATEDVFG